MKNLMSPIIVVGVMAGLLMLGMYSVDASAIELQQAANVQAAQIQTQQPIHVQAQVQVQPQLIAPSAERTRAMLRDYQLRKKSGNFKAPITDLSVLGEGTRDGVIADFRIDETGLAFDAMVGNDIVNVNLGLAHRGREQVGYGPNWMTAVQQGLDHATDGRTMGARGQMLEDSAHLQDDPEIGGYSVDFSHGDPGGPYGKGSPMPGDFGSDAGGEWTPETEEHVEPSETTTEYESATEEEQTGKTESEPGSGSSSSGGGSSGSSSSGGDSSGGDSTKKKTNWYGGYDDDDDDDDDDDEGEGERPDNEGKGCGLGGDDPMGLVMREALGNNVAATTLELGAGGQLKTAYVWLYGPDGRGGTGGPGGGDTVSGVGGASLSGFMIMVNPLDPANPIDPASPDTTAQVSSIVGLGAMRGHSCGTGSGGTPKGGPKGPIGQ